MKPWQRRLWADLGVAIVFALLMFIFIESAVSKVFGGVVGLATAAIAGAITLLGGARIALRIAQELRDLPPTARPDPHQADPSDGLQWDGSRALKWEREPLLTDVIAIIAGLGGIAVGYARQFNAIEYPPGDVRGTPEFDAVFLTISVVIGLFVVAVGSIRLAMGIRRRR